MGSSGPQSRPRPSPQARIESLLLRSSPHAVRGFYLEKEGFEGAVVNEAQWASEPPPTKRERESNPTASANPPHVSAGFYFEAVGFEGAYAEQRRWFSRASVGMEIT